MDPLTRRALLEHMRAQTLAEILQYEVSEKTLRALSLSNISSAIEQDFDTILTSLKVQRQKLVVIDGELAELPKVEQQGN